MWLVKKQQVKTMPILQAMPGFAFSLCGHLWQAIKTGAKWLCNSLSRRNKRLLYQPSRKFIQHEEGYSLTLNFLFLKKYLEGDMKCCHFSEFFKAFSKQYIATKQQ